MVQIRYGMAATNLILICIAFQRLRHFPTAFESSARGKHKRDSQIAWRWGVDFVDAYCGK